MKRFITAFCLSLLFVFSVNPPLASAIYPPQDLSQDIKSPPFGEPLNLLPSPTWLPTDLEPPVRTDTWPIDSKSSLWVVDPEVTFVGKNAARSGVILDNTLKNFQWICSGNCNKNNTLLNLWAFVVMLSVALFILGVAYLVIRNKNNSKVEIKLLPYIGISIILLLSYGFISLIYQFADVIQGFFLSSVFGGLCPPNCITQKDLFYIGWDYRTFVGLRLLGDYNTEAASVALSLTNLTAWTYDIMVFILLLRKIVLWFFIILSPVFVLFFFFFPSMRGIAKILSRECLRWVLYGPLFAILLQGLVYIWKTQIPLMFAYFQPDQSGIDIIFPTSINILLGSSKQFVTPANSINNPETYLSYVFFSHNALVCDYYSMDIFIYIFPECKVKFMESGKNCGNQQTDTVFQAIN